MSRLPLTTTTNAQWHPDLIAGFEWASGAPIAEAYNGVYNMILLDLFCPRAMRTGLHPAVKRKLVPPEMEYWLVYIIRSGELNSTLEPLLFLEIQPPQWIERQETRDEAHRRMLRGFGLLRSTVTVERLYGVSALGTRLRFYCFPGKSESGSEGSSMEYTDEPSTADLWSYDILEEEGASKLKQVAEEVRKMYGKLMGVATPGVRSSELVA
ncbi:hypothetical protein BOTBODRAFT_192505 [Botryobasidium botryosum FD-172 SS1]|uniref:Uncharacterized protein n=1 Tax=Botryobasidium botryosum (strain FD-172 SS1) TaxID=930990 RepID=A0A067LY64_BOTB1|nr:hypothetical protein BOTBODRAFT_192505 [Botryobasidium botryosum FD-172 SS1]